MTDDDAPAQQPAPPLAPRATRRELLSRFSSAAVATSLAVGGGTSVFMAARYLYPAHERQMRWLFVTTLDRLSAGRSIPFRTPSGERVTVARQRDGNDATAFVALSSTCPHLGCQVHWESTKGRFFCPCHNGAFDASGRATEGPPAEAGTDLSRYELSVDRGKLFLLAPIDRLPGPDSRA